MFVYINAVLTGTGKSYGLEEHPQTYQGETVVEGEGGEGGTSHILRCHGKQGSGFAHKINTV